MAFLARAFAEEGIVKGIICHGRWVCAPTTGGHCHLLARTILERLRT